MQKNRLEAFSDGVIAIIITIMVLEIKPPHAVDLASLCEIYPALLSYILSFIYVGIYWNNHHHLLHATREVNGWIMWANLHLLFWQSLVPFVTAWMGENHFAPLPMAMYGVVLLMSAIAYSMLQGAIIANQGRSSLVAGAVGRDRKGRASIVLYIVGIGAAFVNQWLSGAMYVFVAMMWFIPDRRLERVLVEEKTD